MLERRDDLVDLAGGERPAGFRVGGLAGADLGVEGMTLREI